MFETPTPGSGKRFIEDVAAPDTWANFNTRNSHVKHQAIGYLDNQYFRHIRGGRIRVRDIADEPYEVPVRRTPQYTRVPPLATLSNVDVTDVRAMIDRHVVRTRTAVGVYVASACAYLAERFNDYRTVSAEWYGRAFKQFKWVSPVSVLGGVLVLGVLAGVSPAPTVAIGRGHAVHNSLMPIATANISTGSSSGSSNGSAKPTYSSTNRPIIPRRATTSKSTATTSPAITSQKTTVTSVPTTTTSPVTSAVSSPASTPTTAPVPTTSTVTQPTTTSQPTPVTAPAPTPTTPPATTTVIDPVVTKTTQTVNHTVTTVNNTTSTLLTP